MVPSPVSPPQPSGDCGWGSSYLFIYHILTRQGIGPNGELFPSDQ